MGRDDLFRMTRVWATTIWGGLAYLVARYLGIDFDQPPAVDVFLAAVFAAAVSQAIEILARWLETRFPRAARWVRRLLIFSTAPTYAKPPPKISTGKRKR